VPVPLRGVQAPRDARRSIPSITKFKSLITRHLSHIPDSKSLKVSATFAVNIPAPHCVRRSKDSSTSLRSVFQCRCAAFKRLAMLGIQTSLS
ncbi:MAG: hypothetical protein PHS99_03595, partial [Candidatus Marinimicrobia bacterium]|nr:hypothetical protein [Candidatus Neomarinimicrobiota bacterium]